VATNISYGFAFGRYEVCVDDSNFAGSTLTLATRQPSLLPPEIESGVLVVTTRIVNASRRCHCQMVKLHEGIDLIRRLRHRKSCGMAYG
jgi:hypothetical protein